MEPEDRQLRAHGVEKIVGQRRRKTLRDQVEHLLDLAGFDSGPVRSLVKQARCHILLRSCLELGGEQRQRQAVWLTAITLLEIGHVRRQWSPALEPGGEGRWRRIAAATHAQPAGQFLQTLAMALDGEPPVQTERLGRYRRHHRRIAVAIAPDPRGQAEPPGGSGQGRIVFVERRSELGRHAGQRLPEHRVDEVEAGPHFVGHGRTRGASAIGEPELGDLGVEGGGLRSVFAREQIGIVKPPERLGDPLKLREDRSALGLGRMSRQHQFDAQRLQQLRHLAGRETACLESGHRVPDRFSDRGWVLDPLTLTQGADAMRLFGEVHQIEVDREGGGHDPGGVGVEGLHLVGQATRGRPVSTAARFGETADALFGLEERLRLLRAKHLPECLA